MKVLFITALFSGISACGTSEGSGEAEHHTETGNSDGDGDSDCDSDCDSDSDGDLGSDGDADDSDSGSPADADSDGDTDTGSDNDADSDSGFPGDTDSNTDGNADTDSGGDAEEKTDSDTATGTDVGPDGDTDTDSKDDTDSDFGAPSDTGPPATFRNPLNADEGSDPWMLYYQGYYYLAATTWGTTLTMKRGRTIQALKEATPEVIWEDGTPSRCCNVWAPEFHLLDGRWYMYYTAGDGNNLDTQQTHVLEGRDADDPMGPMGGYSYAGTMMDGWAIDGSVLEVNDSRYFLYSAWSGGTQRIWLSPMTSPTATTIRSPQSGTLLSQPEYGWEMEGSDSVNEGPEPLYHDGRVFVVFSASQCADPGYKLGLLELTGDDPTRSASWTKYPQPVFEQANGAFGPGHNGFFLSPDGSENWIAYHATTNPAGSCWTDRTTRIQPFTWKEDGTPDFGVPLSTETDIVVPSGE